VVSRLASHLPHPCVALRPAAGRSVGEISHEVLDLGMELLPELLSI
jgi:hypothetical protein